MQFTLTCPVYNSFRVSQLAGMFDVPLVEKCTQTITVDDLPLDSDWKIGLIVGPSGSGKSSVAKHIFGNDIYQENDWASDKAVIDNFGDLPLKEIVRLLTIVGFSSPPSWIKPYHVLSNGEKFRCDLARALSGIKTAENLLPSAVCKLPSSIVVFDEYTSVVDRNVAKICSAAVAKAIKSGKINGRFVAVTCHYDVTDWLEPDWVLDMATGSVSRRLLRRPPINIQIIRTDRRAWPLFARHHYLTADLPKACRCYMAVWNGEPVAFCGVMAQYGTKNLWRVSRIVTLPDYQGVGIGAAFLEGVGDLYLDEGLRYIITASHPAIREHCARSPKWRTTAIKKIGSKNSSAGRAIVSFEYNNNKPGA